MDSKFLKPYDHKAVETDIYKKWEDSGYFNPDNLPGERTESFSIVLPPPNVTGTLHLGHAAMLAVEDILVRFARMRGLKTLWVPGTDHAAIATQSKVEKEIQKKEGVNRHDLGRETFLKRVEEFAQASHDTIVNQVRRMGASVDWSREAYTLDDSRRRAVNEAFIRMHKAGLIYQGERIVNWDPKGQTVISDDEIVYREEKSKFYYFTYGPFTIGTARPETKFGDKYVVMHPDDARYAQYKHGDTLEVEWINGPITATVIKDAAANPEFGTGVMTITPWHSGIDFEIAERHKLNKEQVIDKYGKLLPIAGEFAGLKIAEAREKIVEKMREKGLLVKVDEDYVHNVATAERTEAVIEPQIMKQWFVAVNKEFERDSKQTTLKEIMRKAVESKNITITPDHFEKIYYHWIDNLRDWCISRQIWFGHRVPAWYKGEEIRISAESPGEGWEQDSDTLDTWFSSGLWTFSTLGWPEETADMRTYHPTSVLETGYDILFFWVARMILMSGFLLDTVPFQRVYLHGLVRDEKGRKMSKSLGNIIDPLDMIEKYGADAVRLSLIVGAAPGNDLKLSEDRIRGYKNFANKIWNIARFVLESGQAAGADSDATLAPEDEAIVEEARGAAQEAATHIDSFRLDLAADTMYQFIWHRFADAILEESKPLLKGPDAARAKSRAAALLQALEVLLKGMHPFMPFVTEEIWSSMPNTKDLLMVEAWPAKETV
ncbi:MAG TPA: valine--tRNA ligase [Candidatus Paceibacterota bacterium]|nr:valine--tRNA ligase [Candidatus Paceibacterota bacterium]